MRYRFIGDTLLTVPFLRQLRRAYPNAHIDLLAAPQSGEVLKNCPYIDGLIFFDTTRKHRYENSNEYPPRSFWSYVGSLRSRKYDTAFVLKRSLSSALLAFLAGIPERIGFNTEGRGLLLTRQVPYRKDRHEIDCFLDVLQASGVVTETSDHALECWPSIADNAAAEHRLAMSLYKGTPLPAGNVLNPPSCRHVVLHLTSSNRAKEWPQSQALELLKWFLSQPSLEIHALGAPSDATVYDSLRHQLPDTQQSRLHNHCGMFSLTESLAFLQRMDLLVGVDSGTLHMAAAAQIRVVALFGPMNPAKWAPPGAIVLQAEPRCPTCRSAKPVINECTCMQHLPATQVIETIEPILKAWDTSIQYDT